MNRPIGSFARKYADSLHNLRELRPMVGISMLLAVSIALSFFTVNLGENIKISFGFLITAFMGMLYGPAAGAAAAGIGDLIKYLSRPSGPYFFGFTLTAILEALIYGTLFYQSRCTIFRVIAAKASVTFLLNCFLNTFWLHLLYGTPFMALFLPRIIKNLVMLPIEIAVLYLVLNNAAILNPRVRIRNE